MTDSQEAVAWAVSCTGDPQHYVPNVWAPPQSRDRFQVPKLQASNPLHHFMLRRNDTS